MPAPRPAPARAAAGHRRGAALVAGAAASVLLAAAAPLGCARPAGPGAPAAGDTLYVGYTSAAGDAGDEVVRGLRLAVATLNAERGPGERPFGLRAAAVPAGRSPSSQVAVAAALRDDSSVVAVVGPRGSSEVLHAAPVLADVEHDGARAVAALTPSASNPAVSRASAWLFRLCPSDDDAAVALARFAAESLGVRRVAVVFRNDLFGRGFTARVAPEFEARGVRVAERDPYLAGRTRYDAYAARIARGGADALLIAGSSDDVGAIVDAVRAAGARPAVLGTDDVGASAARLARHPAARGMRFVEFAAPAGPEAARFRARFRAAYGAEPGDRAALSHDGALMAGRAARAAARDGVRGAQALRRAVRDRLARVGREDPAFAGAGGVVRFDATRGAVGRPVWIGRVGGAG